MTSEEKRLKVRDAYRVFIGRNCYSQARRDYCLTPYRDGKYYSDCSSSISWAYKAAGFGFGILNTVGMWSSEKFTEVPVRIEKGQIADPRLLRVGDILLYAGSDMSRARYDHVGHAEMVGEREGGKWILYGHGSGKPKKTELTAKNKSRYASRTSTRIGNRGLLKVLRFIQDEPGEGEREMAEGNGVRVKAGSWNLKTGPGTGYDVICAISGGANADAVRIACDGWSFVRVGARVGFISDSAIEGVDA